MAILIAEAQPEAETQLVHVDKATVPAYDQDLGVLEPNRLRTRMQALVADRETPVQVHHQIEYGNPSKKLLEVANEDEVDLIVVGTHGTTGLMSLLMGSVAESVVRDSDRPVIALKTPAT